MFFREMLLKEKGMTLIELLVVVILAGLIFGLGLFPMLGLFRLTDAERAQIALMDEMNLVVSYIVKDANRADEVDLPSVGVPSIQSVTFWINEAAFDANADPNIRTMHAVRYFLNANELWRVETCGAGNNAHESQRLITDKVDTNAAQAGQFYFQYWMWPNPQPAFFHHLAGQIILEDLTNNIDNMTRRFLVMLRCRSASLGPRLGV
ncbi:MAG: type II secretion system protein [Candidatus Omnitrophota bacterium]